MALFGVRTQLSQNDAAPYGRTRPSDGGVRSGGDIVESGAYAGREGIYHFSNEGVCSWYDFAHAIAAEAGHTQCTIEPCHSSEYPPKVERPAYSVLDKSKIKATFGVRIPHWTESLKVCMKNLKNL